MNWKLVKKDPRKQPKGNDYTLWKEQIAEECYHQCVYCSIHEQPWGGIDNYHIDHLRPKTKDKFKHLINDICNLFYSCPVCNRFKKDDWPGEPDNLDKVCYPDPSKVDYSTLFILDNSDYSITGKNIAANYLIIRLYLNRPQLIYERRESILRKKEEELTSEVQKLLNTIDDKKLFKEAYEIINILLGLHRDRTKIRPYKLAEIRKP